MTLNQLTALFGWMTVINMALLALTALAIVAFRGTITAMQSRMFGLDEKELARGYFRYLGQFKIAVLVLNLTPWIALRILGG